MFENPFKKKDGKTSFFAFKRINPLTGKEATPPSKTEIQLKTRQIETTKKMKTPEAAPAQSAPVGSRGGSSGSSCSFNDDLSGGTDSSLSGLTRSRAPIIGGANGGGASRRR